MINFMDHAVVPHGLDVHWHAGWSSAKHDPAPEIQVHAYDPHTIILRQNMSVHFEAPFMFLLFGNARAMLIDTGATPEPEYFPLRNVVDRLIEEWLARHPRESYELVVAHTHGHGDHRAADGQFASRSNTTVVGTSLEEVVEFYGFDDWPTTNRELDLGGRVIDVIPGPGHHASATVFYDRSSELLLTGDNFLPGMLYIRDWDAYRETIERLIAFCDSHPVRHILGCHIEMTTTPGDEYPRGTTYQPDEPPLQMTVTQLRSLRDALKELDGRPGEHQYDDFLVCYEP
ncbi:MBL fold metallo-hydrolase [Stackebrandtia soli]|uniref:MBL fold metallo-hydrolase n=1 Tax=Stackebrandtia soli TaxID=1892856 RepID=UPI0039EA7D3D